MEWGIESDEDTLSPQPSSLMVGEVPPEPDWLALAAKQVASSKFIFLS